MSFYDDDDGDDRWWTVKVPWPIALLYLLLIGMFLWIASTGVLRCP